MEESREDRIRQFIGKDPFARLLGAAVEIVAPGHSRVRLTITDEMVNFHGHTHGGVIFSLGDIAFAAASNSRGQKAVALNVGITFLKATGPGDRLVAEAMEQSQSGPTALYDITIRDEGTGEIVAKSQDLVYRKKEWFIQEDAMEIKFNKHRHSHEHAHDHEHDHEHSHDGHTHSHGHKHSHAHAHEHHHSHDGNGHSHEHPEEHGAHDHDHHGHEGHSHGDHSHD